jgi:putative addiction module killer protein
VVSWHWRIQDRLWPRLRIYFAQQGKTILLLLAGGTKKQQQRDIEAAILQLAAYKARRK